MNYISWPFQLIFLENLRWWWWWSSEQHVAQWLITSTWFVRCLLSPNNIYNCPLHSFQSVPVTRQCRKRTFRGHWRGGGWRRRRIDSTIRRGWKGCKLTSWPAEETRRLAHTKNLQLRNVLMSYVLQFNAVSLAGFTTFVIYCICIHQAYVPTVCVRRRSGWVLVVTLKETGEEGE